jgi:hypothetical protein
MAIFSMAPRTQSFIRARRPGASSPNDQAGIFAKKFLQTADVARTGSIQVQRQPGGYSSFGDTAEQTAESPI